VPAEGAEGVFVAEVAGPVAFDLGFFLKNPRLSMMARNREKQSPEKQAAHRKAADGFLAGLTVSLA
jgi:hypothetical protein